MTLNISFKLELCLKVNFFYKRVNLHMEKKPGDISIGDELTNQEIVSIFKCGNQGGMRRSIRENCLIIITDHTKSLYDDRIDSKGILHYTGMGTKGDQELDKTQNKTLNESKDNDIKVYFFEKYGQKSSYRFNGEVELDDEPYEGKQYDELGVLRKVYIFPLRPIDTESFPLIGNKELNETIEIKEKKTKRLSNRELAERVTKLNHTSSTSNTYRKVISKQYDRNELVKEYARRRAAGYCQLCDEPAPFESNGVPFLEVHHIEWLAEGGPDTVDNVVALCPNCHRKMHIINKPIDVQTLVGKAKELLSFS